MEKLTAMLGWVNVDEVPIQYLHLITKIKK
jgi:hypothetical protein